jgi:hypothetical protein
VDDLSGRDAVQVACARALFSERGDRDNPETQQQAYTFAWPLAETYQRGVVFRVQMVFESLHGIEF